MFHCIWMYQTSVWSESPWPPDYACWKMLVISSEMTSVFQPQFSVVRIFYLFFQFHHQVGTWPEFKNGFFASWSGGQGAHFLVFYQKAHFFPDRLTSWPPDLELKKGHKNVVVYGRSAKKSLIIINNQQHVEESTRNPTIISCFKIN